MKKIFGLLLIVLATSGVRAQTDTTQAPYLRFPTVPPFKILKVDSATYYTKENLKKNKPALIMVFNPGCEHCQHETEEITKNIADFKNIQIVMTTPDSFEKMKNFYIQYKLKNYSNIIVGRDEHFTLPTFYYIHNLPCLAFYNKNHKLISVHEGTWPVEKILEEFKK